LPTGRRTGIGLALVPLAAIAAAKLLLQLLAIGQYGYFRDELYYLACTEHLAFGYVDHPPLSIAVLAAVRAVFGDSLVAIRIVPAVAGVATVLLTGALARRLGGGVFAQTLAALCALLSPQYLGTNHYFSMNSLDILLWTVAIWFLLDALETGTPRSWIALGLTLGLALLNKISVLWLARASGRARSDTVSPHAPHAVAVDRGADGGTPVPAARPLADP
jgi:4-amino-4-deoxy-L-arabinose transferase-like glycosyltransferase